MRGPKHLPAPVAALLPSLTAEEPVWLVGGAVRDHLLGRPTADLDFAVAGKARRLARRVADALGGAYYDLDRARDSARVILSLEGGGRRSLDFARLRGADLRADLAARDFTLDAMALPLTEPTELIDPTGGLQDLKDKVLRACGPQALADDPVRALRAVRLACDLGLTVEPDTLRQLKRAGPGLARVSPERLRDELFRLLADPRPGGGLRLLDHLRLLTVVLPELEPLRGMSQPPAHAHDGLDHTLAVVDRMGDLLGVLGRTHDSEAAADLTLAEAALRLGRFREPLNDHLEQALSFGRTTRQCLVFAALLHDAGKPGKRSLDAQGRLRFLEHEAAGALQAEARARELRLSAVEAARVREIVAGHMRPESLEASPPISDRAVYRFFRDLGPAGVDVVLLSLADLLGRYAGPPPQHLWSDRLETARRLLEAYFEARGRRIEPPALVRGDELMQALGLPAGPQVGRLLEALREAQAAGEIATPEEALALARRLHSGDSGLGQVGGG